MIESILSFLFLGWFFWVAVPVCVLATYICVHDDREFDWAPLTWLAIIAGFILMRYPEIRGDVFSVKGIATLLGSYIAAGGLVALWKWVTVLMDFRKDAPAKLANIKAHSLSSKPLASQFPDALYDRYSGPKVKEVDGSFYPDSTTFPIATWWTYWPFFLLNVILDPITRIVRQLVAFCKDIYEFIAKKFVIKS